MPRFLLTGTALLGFAFAPMIVGAIRGTASAEPGKRTARPIQSAPRGHTAPDVTATIPRADKQPKGPRAQDIYRDDETLPAPFNLPTASRAQIRACGEAWQAMKMSGQAADQTWRAYATKCLAKKGGPETTKSP